MAVHDLREAGLNVSPDEEAAKPSTRRGERARKARYFTALNRRPVVLTTRGSSGSTAVGPVCEQAVAGRRDLEDRRRDANTANCHGVQLFRKRGAYVCVAHSATELRVPCAARRRKLVLRRARWPRVWYDPILSAEMGATLVSVTRGQEV